MASLLDDNSNGATERRLREMNQALLVSSVHQHELTEQAQRAEEDADHARQTAEKLNAQLRASEGRYRTLFELGPVAVYSCDAAGVIQEFNRRATELWGRVPAPGDFDERFCGSFRMIRADGSELPHQLCPMADVLSGAIPYARDAEVGIERPDGSQVTVVVNIRPVKNERGEITGAINCFYDITERKQMEQRLRASEERYRTLAEQVKDYAIFRTDVQGRALTWNQGVQRILGFGEADFLYQDIGKIIFTPDDVLSGAAQHELDTAAAEGTCDDDRWMRRKNGERFFANGTTAALKDDNGDLIGFTKVMRDMTDSRLADSMIRCQRESLELLLMGEPIEQVLDALAHSVERESQGGFLVAIHLMEADGRHFGYVTAPSLPASYAQMARSMDVRLESGPCSAAVVSRQPAIVRDFAGETRWPAFTARMVSLGLRGCFTTPMLSPLPESGVLGIFALYYREPCGPSPHDRQLVNLATHAVALAINRTQADDRIKLQAGQLADESRRKDEFLAMLSHELRNPLASIVNATQLLRLQQDRNPIQVQAHGLIDRQVAQLTHLVDDLLEVSRISSGRIRLNAERVDFRGIVQRAIESVQPRASRKEQSLAHALLEEPLWVNGDPMRLEQVVVNLLDNAVKYTDAGGAIQIALQADGNEAVLRVRDTGVGIAPEMLPHIFDLFTQADRSLDRAQGGLGIGLALVRSLVAMHRGRVEAHSIVGEGSEFIVALSTLPLPDAPRATAATQAPACARAVKVLVVDDNIDAAQSMTMLLQALGHDARMAHDGRDAIKAALEYVPDVVLLDIGLPVVDGLQVAKRIRAEPALQKVVLVAVTGYGQESDRQHSQAAGFNHHLVKPVDFAKVASILADVADVADVAGDGC